MIDEPDPGRDDLAMVSVWMKEFAAQPIAPSARLDPQCLFWKAQLLKRWDAEARATRPIEVAEQVPAAAALVAAAALAGWFYFFAGTVSAFR